MPMPLSPVTADFSAEKTLTKLDVELLVKIAKDREDLVVDGKVADGSVSIMLSAPNTSFHNLTVFYGETSTNTFWRCSQDTRFLGM
jgi:hypothetical protein